MPVNGIGVFGGADGISCPEQVHITKSPSHIKRLPATLHLVDCGVIVNDPATMKDDVPAPDFPSGPRHPQADDTFDFSIFSTMVLLPQISTFSEYDASAFDFPPDAMPGKATPFCVTLILKSSVATAFMHQTMKEVPEMVKAL